MNAPTVIYVVTHDGGCEGQSLPLLASFNREHAVGFCIGHSDSLCVTEVPIFPDMPKEPWYRLTKIWPAE